MRLELKLVFSSSAAHSLSAGPSHFPDRRVDKAWKGGELPFRGGSLGGGAGFIGSTSGINDMLQEFGTYYLRHISKATNQR